MKRYGHRVHAADAYADAPAMQLADEAHIVNMLDGDALDTLVNKVRPDIIVPEIEAIRTERLFDYEKQGYRVVPSAYAVNMTMNRKSIRDLATTVLGLKTARYMYATTQQDYLQAIEHLGFPHVIKPLMSSSGKGQSVVRTAAEAQPAWERAMFGSRGDIREVIIEEFINFESEITLLTVTQGDNGVADSQRTIFCPPIGHRQERGDYQESWLPHAVDPVLLNKAQDAARKITNALGGTGLWGVEFFLTSSEVYFSELSPRPHDTGMVTLAGCIPLNEFELHARAILGYPIAPQKVLYNAASAVILAAEHHSHSPEVQGLDRALEDPSVEIRIFGKPSAHPYRRMGVALAHGSQTIDYLRKVAQHAASCVFVG